MKPWAFLIQKEGEPVWHQISEQELPLAPGRYRIVAHSSRANLQVEVRVTHQGEEAGETIVASQTNFRRTNSQGLMMVLPFTYLGPGIWDIRCYGDLMSELLGNSWQQKIQLKVSSPLPQIPRETAPQVVNSQATTYLEQLEQLIRQEIEPSLRKSLNLSLTEDILSGHLGESLEISGSVTLNQTNDVQSPVLVNGKLCYQLRSAETKKVVLTETETLDNYYLPFSFKYTLSLPASLVDTALEGEVILETQTQKITQPFTVKIAAKVAASRAFNYTITLSNVEQRSSFAFDLILDEKYLGSSSKINLPEPSTMVGGIRPTQSKVTQILPPKIHSPKTKIVKKVELPTVKSPANQAQKLAKKPEKTLEQQFKSLDLQSRFLSRLNHLANETKYS